jgi:pseudaminic acid synthase
MEIYKISSFHVTDLNLVEAIATKKKPVIMSTGMSTLEEIDQL